MPTKNESFDDSKVRGTPALYGVARRLKKYRRQARLTQSDLSAKTHAIGIEITKARISEIEAVRRKDIGIIQISALCNALNIPYCALMTDIEQPFLPCDFPGFTFINNFAAIESLWSWRKLAEDTEGTAHRWSGITTQDTYVLQNLQRCVSLNNLCVARIQNDISDIGSANVDELLLIRDDLRDVIEQNKECRTILEKLSAAGVQNIKGKESVSRGVEEVKAVAGSLFLSLTSPDRAKVLEELELAISYYKE